MTEIRIGTLVPGDEQTESYVSQILQHGFESFQITFWEDVCLDLAPFAAGLARVIGDHDVKIDCLGIYGNPLEDQGTVEAWERLIDNAHLFGASVVSGFAGRLRDRPVEESIARFATVFAPLAKRAAERGIRLAVENCDWNGNWERGDYNIALCPTAWERMFEAVPDENIGLEWDPSHTMGGFMDPVAQLRCWAPRIFHVHGKDATMNWDVIRERGIRGPEVYYGHRTPGFGDADWTDFISILRGSGYTGSIDIEGWHDPVYRDDLEMTGQVAALHYLKRCRGGDLVQNPTRI